MRKILQLALILIPLTTAAQSHQRIPLLTNISVHADTMHLADLLPAKAPESLRTQAKQIALGSAPGIGLQRTLERAEIASAIPPEIAIDLEIPQSVIVSRWTRNLTRDEILAAIEKSLDANHASSKEPLSPSDITFDSPISVTEDAPTLNVVRFEPRTNSAGTHVALWTASEPRTPPFWITVDRELDLEPKPAPPATEDLNGSEAPLPPANARKAATSDRLAAFVPVRRAAPAANPNMVHVGDAIELIVKGNGMRIATKATALESGGEGQRIRVKTANAEKVLVAKIVGAQTAEIDY